MPNIIEAGLVAKGKRFGIIASRFNDPITERRAGKSRMEMTFPFNSI